MTVAFLVFCLHLARDERPPSGPARLRPADLHLGAVGAQGDAFGGGVGEDIGQRMQPQARVAGHREAAGRQQRPDFLDGPGDGGAVHAVEDASAACGSWNRRTTKVAMTRSVKTSSWQGPPPSTRWR